MLIKQRVTQFFAERRITHHHRYDMAEIIQMRHTNVVQTPPQSSCAFMKAFTFVLALPQVTNGSTCTRGNRGRQGRGEDKAGGKGSNKITHGSTAGDIATNHAESLRQRAFNDSDAIRDAITLRDAAAAWTIKSDRMNLITIGHGTVGIGHVTDIADRRDIPIHGIDAFESDQLRRCLRKFCQHTPQIGDVIMLEENALRFAVAHALNHGGMIHLIRDDDATRQLGPQGRK